MSLWGSPWEGTTLTELAGCTQTCTGQAALPAYTWEVIKQPRKLNQEFYNFTKQHN